MKIITNDKIRNDILKIIEFLKKSEITDKSILSKEGLDLFSILSEDKKKGRTSYIDNIKILKIDVKERKNFFDKIFNFNNKFKGYEIEVASKLNQYFLKNGEFDKTWGSDNKSVANVYTNDEQIEKDKQETLDVVFKIKYNTDLKIDYFEFEDNTRFNAVFPW